MKNVIVVIGAGSIGQAIARRVSAGKHVILAEKAVERGNLGILTSIGKKEALQIIRDAF